MRHKWIDGGFKLDYVWPISSRSKFMVVIRVSRICYQHGVLHTLGNEVVTKYYGVMEHFSIGTWELLHTLKTFC